jgi:hypothetical protein
MTAKIVDGVYQTANHRLEKGEFFTSSFSYMELVLARVCFTFKLDVY